MSRSSKSIVTMVLALFVVLPISDLRAGAPDFQVADADDGVNVIFSDGQKFPLAGGKGFLNPPVTGNNIVAINYEICIGGCDLHIYLKTKDGKIREIQNVNDKIVKANPDGTKGDSSFFAAVKISGNEIEVMGYHNEFPNFKIKIEHNGAISLGK